MLQDWGEGTSALGSSGAWETALLGAGAVLGSAVFDRSVSRSVDRHFGSRALDTLDGVGKWLPVAAIGGGGPAPRPARGQGPGHTGLPPREAGGTRPAANPGDQKTRRPAPPPGEKGAARLY